MNLFHDLVGYTAATLTTLAFIPQTLKSWRTRDLGCTRHSREFGMAFN